VRQSRYTFNREHWHWGVLEDVRWLAATRYPGGIVAEGMRDTFGHLAACQIARVIKPRPLFHEIVAITREFLPASYVYAETDGLRGHCSTLLKRAMGAAEGELVTYGDGQRTPIYTYSKQRLIDTLEVTPDEEQHMTRLISDSEKRKRERERRTDDRRTMAGSRSIAILPRYSDRRASRAFPASPSSTIDARTAAGRK
jgi:hypothetical protein